MALLWMDGFEMSDHALRYTGAAGASTNTVTRFNSGRSIGNNVGGTLIQRGFAPMSRMIVGLAASLAAGDNSTEIFAFFGDNGATQHLQIRVMSTGAIAAYRGTSTGTFLAATPGPVWAFGAWNYLEASATISDTVGVVKVRVNGAEVLSFTGDTKNAGTATTIDTFRIQALGTTANGYRHDDFYLSDDTGPAPWNDFLGDVRVVTLAPTGPGATTGLTPSVAPNWGCVDEQPYSATDFVSSATVGAKDTYACADLPAGATAVYGVQMNTIGKKTDAGARSLKNVVRVGTTDYSDAAAQALSTSDSWYRTMRTVNPATSAAWTPAAVNAMEIGVEVA